MTKAVKVGPACLCAGLMALSGCSTVVTLAARSENFQCDEGRGISRVYSGVSNDIRFWAEDYQDKEFAIIDFPFSLVLDTVVLPYTVYSQSRYGDLCPGAPIEEPSDQLPAGVTGDGPNENLGTQP